MYQIPTFTFGPKISIETDDKQLVNFSMNNTKFQPGFVYNYILILFYIFRAQFIPLRQKDHFQFYLVRYRRFIIYVQHKCSFSDIDLFRTPAFFKHF